MSFYPQVNKIKERTKCRKTIEFIYDNYYFRHNRTKRFEFLMDLVTGIYVDAGMKVFITNGLKKQAKKMLNEEFHIRKK